MYMEPDGAESAPTVQSRKTKAPKTTKVSRKESQSSEIAVALRPVRTSIQVSSSESKGSIVQGNPVERNTDQDEVDESQRGDSQTFFPAFTDIFNTHRISFADPQSRYRQGRLVGFFQRDRGFQTTAAAAATSPKELAAPALLGSGNFGVIQGGTYYPEEKTEEDYNLEDGLFSPYSYHTRGSKAKYYKNPKPLPVKNGDIFANFRDFADITAPARSSFSHLSVVYANKNGDPTTVRTHQQQPRNIFETLRMLEEQEGQDQEDLEQSITTTTTEEAVPKKKLSKSKRKLMKFKKYQEEKARKLAQQEPLLALS